MNWQHALEISQTLGFALGMVFRLTPKLKNDLAPKASFITLLIVNVAAMWQAFAQNAGLATDMLFPHQDNVALAGFFSVFKVVLAPVLAIAQPIVLSVAQNFVNRIFWELGGKPVFTGSTAKF